jgi:RND superfamily putative drug exporter
VPLLHERVEPASRVDGAESAELEQLLRERFGSPFANAAVLVVSGLEGADTDAGRARMRELMAGVAALPFVTAVLSPGTMLDTLLVGHGGQGAMAMVGLDPAFGTEAALAALRSTTSSFEPSGLSFEWTGQAALEQDMRHMGAADTRRAELRALPVMLVLACWAFGSLAGAFAGLLAGAVTVLVALGGAALLSLEVPLTLLAPSMVSLFALALGLDYMLVVLLRGAEGGTGAAGPAARQTVLVAGAAAAAGFLPLLFMPVSELRTAGLASLIAILAAVSVGCALAPRLAAAVSAWSPGRLRPGPTPALVSWSGRLVKRPGIALLIALPPLLLLAGTSLRMRAASHDATSLPASLESVRALRHLEQMRRIEAAMRVRVLMELPANESAFTPQGWSRIGEFEAALQSDPRVGGTRSVRTIASGIPPEVLKQVTPAAALRSFTSRDERLALIEVIPRQHAGAPEVESLIRDLRARRVAGATAGLWVGGVSAFSLDYSDAVVSRAARTALLAVIASAAVLFIALRSLLLAIKAVLLNLLSVAAALGATVLVFQEGWGAEWFGLQGPLGGLPPSVPLLIFCAVFGIGMDYEVFLLTRVAEARRSGSSETDAIRTGLADSARVIVRSAAIMIGVFVAFVPSAFVSVKTIGFALSVAIALDATLTRLVLAPALLTIAGRWNWWPGERCHAAGRTHTTVHERLQIQTKLPTQGETIV